MRTVICDSAAAVARYGGAQAAALLNEALNRAERARLLLATGQSQMGLLQDLVRRDVDWARVDAFHLDEYVGLEPSHPASFRLYLKKRFADIVPVAMHYVDTESPEQVARLGATVLERAFDVALVGIGENGHIAFNDPPADFTTEQPYLEVALDERCRAQQVNEGWFPTIDAVPERAVTMSVRAILGAKAIVSAVPYLAKADAVQRLFALTAPDPSLPASALLEHPAVTLLLDRDSSSLLDAGAWRRCVIL